MLTRISYYLRLICMRYHIGNVHTSHDKIVPSLSLFLITLSNTLHHRIISKSITYDDQLHAKYVI